MSAFKVANTFQLSNMNHSFGKDDHIITLSYGMMFRFLSNLDSKTIVLLGDNISYQAKNLWEFIFYKNGDRWITFNANERCKLVRDITKIDQMPYGGHSDLPKALETKDMLTCRLLFLTLDGLYVKTMLTDWLMNRINPFSDTLRKDIIQYLKEDLDMKWVKKMAWPIRHCHIYNMYYLSNIQLFNYLVHLMTPLLIKSVENNIASDDLMLITNCVSYENEMADFLFCTENL